MAVAALVVVFCSGCMHRTAQRDPVVALPPAAPVSYTPRPSAPLPAASYCKRTTLLSFEEATHGNTPGARVINIDDLGGDAIGFVADMHVDVDGAPNAYNVDDAGIDYLANAGLPILDNGKQLSTGASDWQKTWKTYFARAKTEGFRGSTRFNWFGLVTTDDGVPVVQGQDDPFPGYFVSRTSLRHKGAVPNDPRPAAYLDSREIPYIVLPNALLKELNVSLGDFAVVFDPATKAMSFAIVGDIGPSRQLGEGSIKALLNLGHNPFVGEPPRAKRGHAGAVIYLIFRKSGDGHGKEANEIAATGEQLFGQWGGLARLRRCFQFP